jgi:hypothetical protein
MGTSSAALPRPILAALGIGGALLVAQLVVLVISLSKISSTEEHVAATDAKVTAAFSAVRPIADRATAALEDSEPVADDVRTAAQDAERLLGALAGESDELADLLDALPVLDAGFRGLFARLFPVLEAVDGAPVEGALAQLGGILPNLGMLAAQLAEEGRLAGTLDQAAVLLSEIDERNLVNRAVQSDRTLRAVLEVQRHTLGVQRRSLAVQLHSLRVQLRSLDHVRSLDEKTGGDVLSP